MIAMLSTDVEKRKADRLSLSLSAVIKAKENKDTFWKEVAEVISVSSTGAGFHLQHECHVGQLLSLILPLPHHLRCYDEDRELYRVWGLVQHCSVVAGEDFSGFHVGVAFIGKNAPASYNENPKQSYRICGMNENGLWKIEEARTAFVIRRHPRFWIDIDVTLARRDTEGNLLATEETETENISQSGAAVISVLEANIGDCVKFSSKEYKFSTLAVVRNRQLLDDNTSRLHLEFVDSVFPIEDINLPVDHINEL